MNDSMLPGIASQPGTALLRAGTAATAQSPIDLERLPKDARRAAEDFEAFFLTQAMSNMFAGVETDPLFGGGPGESAYRSFLTQEYGKIVARAGGIGIADSVAREIIKLQEAA